MGKAKRTLGVIMAALMLVVTCMTYVPAKAAVVLPTVKFVGLQNIPAAVGEEQTLFLTSNFDGNVQYQVFYVQRNDPSKAATTTWTKLGDWTTAADAKTPVEVKVPAGTITVAGNYSFAIRVKRAGVTGQNSNTYGDYDSAYAFNYVFAATATAGLKDAKLASAEVTVNEKFVISGLTAGNSYRLFTLNEARADRWDKAAVATSTTNTIEWAPTVAGSYVLDLQLLDAAGKVTAVKLFNVKVVDKFAVLSASADNLKEIKVSFSKDALMVDSADSSWAYSALNEANYAINAIDASNGPVAIADATKIDSKTVLLTLSPAVKNTSTVALTVNANIKDAAKAVVNPVYTLAYISADTKAPTATASVDVLKTVTLTFSEPMASIGTVYVNGTATTFTLAGNAKSATATLGSAYEAGKTYNVVIVGAYDFKGNYMSTCTLPITLGSDTTKPEVLKVEPLADATKVRLTFSEPLLDPTEATPIANNFVTVAFADMTGLSKGTTTTAAVVADTDSKVYDVTLPFTLSGDYLYVNATVSAYKDYSANAGDSKTFRILIQKDKTAPAYKEYKLAADRKSLYIYLSEDVAINGTPTVNVTYTNNDGIVYATEAVTPTLATDADGVQVLVVAPLTAAWHVDGLVANELKTGTYTLSVPASAVKDLSAQANLNALFSVSATVGTGTATADTTAPTITGTSVANNVITITSGEDLVLPTAANFTLDGGALPTGSKVYFYLDKKTVKVELPYNTIALTGYRVFGYSLKDAAGNVSASSTALNFNENVQPYIASVVIADPLSVVMTASEAVKSAGTYTDDFEVYVNGTKVTPASIVLGGDKKTITITLASADAVALSAVVQVKVVGSDLVDDTTNANPLVTGATITATR